MTFRQDGTELSVLALAGTLSAPEDAAHWYRFGVERKAHRIILKPAMVKDEARAAVYFSWARDAAVPGEDALSALFDELATAIPTAG